MRHKYELESENARLREENARLLRYIGAMRCRFGDCAVNAAIMELCPPPRERREPPNWREAIERHKSMIRATPNGSKLSHAPSRVEKGENEN